MADITSWLGSGDPPTLDSLLDLSDTFGHTENHPIQNMDLSLLDNETFIDGYSLFDGCNSSNQIGPDESAIQTQSELVSSNILQGRTFLGLENLPEVFFGESHDSILPGAGPQVTVNSGEDQNTANEQREKRPRSPTSQQPQPRKKSGVASPRPRSSKQRSKLSFNSKKVLEDFFKDNIYPKPNDVARLAKQTGVEKQQIKTWFRNQRTRKLKVDMSGGPEDIPESPCGPSDQTFATALADIPSIDPKALMERYLGVPLDQDNHMPAMVSPAAEPRGDQIAAGSDSSWSSCGSQNSWSSRRGRRKVNTYRKTGLYDPISDPSKYRCTFCGVGLKDRYQWKRHEETKHAPRTGWICKDAACADKPIEDSIYFREDLFKQHRAKHATHGSPIAHGRSRHSLTRFEIVSANPIPEAHPALQCGFCGERFLDWANRVAHIAAHFEEGANFSSWWLKRAEFIAERKDPPRLWPHDDFKAVLPHSVFCIYCERLYLSLEDAEARHPECTIWSCGQFEGILAAYEKESTVLQYRSSLCRYCNTMVFEVASGLTERLRHLIRDHAYRSCIPRKFLEFSDFRDHLTSSHKALPANAETLESAYRLTRKSRFRSATDISNSGITNFYFQSFPHQSFVLNINILGRGIHGDLCFASTLAYFDSMSPHNIVSLQALRSLHPQIDLQMEESEDVVLDTLAGHIGHVVIQWAGDWGALPPPAPGVHATRFFVVDHGHASTLTFGYPVMEELNMAQRFLLSV